MNFSHHIAKQIAALACTKGKALYTHGAVTIWEGNELDVHADVHDGETFHVGLHLDKLTLEVACSCPPFETSGACAHIWAAILGAEARGMLGGKYGIGPANIDDSCTLDYDGSGARDSDEEDEGDNKKYEEDDDEEDEEDEGDDEEDRDGDSSFDGSDAEEDQTPVFQPTLFRPSTTAPAPAPAPAPALPTEWRSRLRQVKEQARGPRSPLKSWPSNRQIVYVIDLTQARTRGTLVIHVGYRTQKKNGDWGTFQFHGVSWSQAASLPDMRDRQVISLLRGSRQNTLGFEYDYDRHQNRFEPPPETHELLLPLMCGTQRCFVRPEGEGDITPIAWDDGPPWEFRLRVQPTDGAQTYEAIGEMCRGDERRPLSEPLMVFPSLVVWRDRVSRLHADAFSWILSLRGKGPVRVPRQHGEEFLREVVEESAAPPLDLPPELSFEEVRQAPQPNLHVKPESSHLPSRKPMLAATLSFLYGEHQIPATSTGSGLVRDGKLICRDPAAEQAAAARLDQLGFQKVIPYGEPPRFEIAPRKLAEVVRALTAENWRIEADGKLYRQAGNFEIEVRSGVDWFELHGKVSFGDSEVALPTLLAAARRGENTVVLDDGSLGILPEEWLKKYAPLAGLGTSENGHLRFTRAQVGLLDALLASQPEASFDETFVRARDELRSFAGIQPVDAPSTFQGELRGYQRDGIGWLLFLQRFGFGGCLADDMGLGKTIQVLSLLELRRQARQTDKSIPVSVVVVPRSLVFNWKQEAARFTPELRILDFTGVDRPRDPAVFAAYDVVLTTYGTLRRDVLLLKDVPFDYCILDEAQAVKNAKSESAKAVRLIQARNRLAVSGTPIENHLGELWSLFEFLNPGMLGTASTLKMGGSMRTADADARELLARALRPFILRRTKEMVAKDLPAKTVQTLYCDLEPTQRKQYDELRDHYRRALLEHVGRVGINKSKIQVLEALLRLRQAACHPGLVAKSLVNESSAKLDVLLPQLREVNAEGHKALVFSQFTSLLAIVRKRLDDDKVPYEYLDGRTHDRAARVEHFQQDPKCKLFLISLKAGGLGLNLTEAEYVFLLDPWWNPAVEAQAIDRTHRIGQSRPVFAYRLIARDTVEEKVLELQEKKRDLADAILRADNALIRDLSREDLELLLS